MTAFSHTRPSPSGLALIKHFEGFRAQAYPDPLHGWAIATIGYGTTRYASGRKVQQGDTLSTVQAEQELIAHLSQQVLPALNQIPSYQAMNAAMRGALESFAYNLGAGFYGAAHFQTISRVLRERDWQQMRPALLLYINPGSAVEVGLRRRRTAEADLWEQGLILSRG